MRIFVMKCNVSRMALAVTAVWMFFAAGCSAAKSVYQYLNEPAMSRPSSIKSDKSGLKKKVLLLPCLNQTDMEQKRFEEITRTFTALVEKDNHLLMEGTEEPIPTTVKIRSPRFGILTDTDVAKRAEEMGIHFLITAVLNPFELRLKRAGVWPFRKVKKEVEMSMVVNAVDLVNGTLFLTNLESEKTEFVLDQDLIEEEGIKMDIPKIDDKTFMSLWTRILERQASVLRKSLRDQPWTGRILSSDGKSIVVNAGSSVGLSTGRVFEVFGRGEPIRSASGRSIYLLGPKVGEIKTVEVREHSASAEPLSEARYIPGQVIRAKN
ncbi:MAG: hypothetical protein JXL84_21235 [Deltaproteobacteria bacterium]|nr:hypothetical protein [Deltaproteobacteria bacterium]